MEFERGLALAHDNVDLPMGLGEIEPHLGRAALLDPAP
jgi:hypothetical protein